MGSAKAWDAARDQQLFLLIVNSVKVDWKVIADEWAKKYPDDPAKPSASAISQHIYKLQKANGNGGGSSKPKATSVFKPSTPSSAIKRTVAKTPSSSSKRQKVRKMSDEDDSEDERANNVTPVKRESTARRTKAGRGAYIEPQSENEEVDEDGFFTSGRSQSRSVNRLDSGPNFTSTRGYASPISNSNGMSYGAEDEIQVTSERPAGKGKKPMSNFDYFHRADEESDASDYQPLV